MPPSGVKTVTVGEFLQRLGQSGLFSATRWKQLQASLPATVRSQAELLAEYLVEQQLLTPFQADKLLRGHWQGLRVGPYELLCPVGRGAMGIVYLARCIEEIYFHAGRLVALKVLPPKRAQDEPRTLARFQRESHIGLKLPSHPHLTRTLDSGESNGVHYLAMEFVPGGNLRQRIVEGGPLPVPVAARIFAGVANGLQQAHAAGFVHRDLKPANIALMPNGQPKILDFGFALILGESAFVDASIIGGSGYTVGTMDFLAPEQAQNAATVTPAADIYSLGCCLYFALTGSHPFPGGTVQEKIRSHRYELPTAIQFLNSSVPDEFAMIVQRCMAKKPDYRPESMVEVAKLLSPWAELPTAERSRDLIELEKQWLSEALGRWQSSRVSLTATEDSLPFVEPSAPEAVPVENPTTTEVPMSLAPSNAGLGMPRGVRKLRRGELVLIGVILAICCFLAGVIGFLVSWFSRS